MTGWRLKRTAQCQKCPWRVGVDPRDIPIYCEAKHRALKRTIAEPGRIDLGAVRAMACHETGDAHCIGWLMNQVGAGNNIALRIQMTSCQNAGKIRLRGEQHRTFEETLP